MNNRNAYIEKLENAKKIFSIAKNTRSPTDIEYLYEVFKHLKFVNNIMDNYGPKVVKTLFQVLSYKEYKKNEKIFSKGEPSLNCYIIFWGEVAFLSDVRDLDARYSGNENIILSTLKEGDILGETTLRGNSLR